MGRVIDMKDYISVRFFKQDILCGYCEQLPRGRVYDGGEAIVCAVCSGPMLELSSNDYAGEATIIFEPEDYDGTS